MDLYIEYIKEVFDRDCYHDEYCFITYNKYPETKEISIIDYYCDQEKRGTGYMLELVTGFIKNLNKEGYTTFYGYVDTDQNGWENSERLMLKFGFKNYKIEKSSYKHFILKLQETN